MSAVFDRIVAWLKKLESIIIDRRAIVVGLFLLLVNGGKLIGVDPGAMDLLNDLFLGAVDANVTLFHALVAAVEANFAFILQVIVVVSLIRSWTQRPPSGVEAFLPRRAGAARPS